MKGIYLHDIEGVLFVNCVDENSVVRAETKIAGLVKWLYEGWDYCQEAWDESTFALPYAFVE